MSELTIIDQQAEKQKRKKQVLAYAKSFVKKKKQYGLNYLEVLSATEKYVEFSEMQNGLQHKHKARHSAESAFTYIDYKLSILARFSEHSIDIENQSPQYKQQLDNINNIKDEICYFIKLLHDESKCQLTYSIQFIDEQIVIQLETGQIITLFLLYDDTSEKIIMQHDIDLSVISTFSQFCTMSFITWISKLILCKTDKMSLEMIGFCRTLVLGSRQLVKLQSLSEVKTIDTTMQADIVQHIERSKVGDTYSYIIGNYDFNDITYQRLFQIRKITRVRSVIEVIAVSSERTIIEYRSVITKISHNINDNTNKILQMFNALK